MWKLTIIDDDGEKRPVPLVKDEGLVIGRAEGSNVRLTDRNISRSHAKVHKDAETGGWVIEDMDSYNGCYVNGERVSGVHPLVNGDVLQLGDYRIEVEDTSQGAAVSPQEEATLTGRESLASLLDRPYRLVVVDGGAVGTEYSLEGKDQFVIGRSEEADVSINHTSVSRIHAELVPLGNGLYELFDRGSSNGLRVNGVACERRVIEDDDEIELGDVRMRFVARGRIFRPGSSARSPRRLASSASGSYPGGKRKGALGLMIGLGAVLAVLLVAIVVLLLPPSKGSSDAQQTASSNDPNTIVELAIQMFNKKDYEGAHKKVNELPADSPMRSNPFVRTIENQWADEMFAHAATTTVPADRRSSLQSIIDDDMVSADRRKRAKEVLERMDRGENPNIEATHHEVAPIVTGKKQASPRHTPTSTHVSKPATTSKHTAPKSTAKKPSSTHHAGTSTKPSSGGNNAEDEARKAVLAGSNDAARRALEPRVRSGNASVAEIKMLRALCRQAHDSACSSMCSAMLRKKRNQ